MERVYATVRNPVNQIDQVAVAIYRDRGHVGLLHKENSAPTPGSKVNVATVVKLLHFGWHDRWGDTAITTEVAFWISPDISPEHAALIAGYCRLIPIRNKAKLITFGFSRPDRIFGADWEISDETAKTGLTCASLVLAVFHRSGLKLIDYDDWVPREEDKPKLMEFLDALKRTRGVTPEHIKCHEAGIQNGQVRFRPLEVAGAAWSSNRPINRVTAESIANQLSNEFDRLSVGTPRPSDV